MGELTSTRNIKQVPQEREVRNAVRELAGRHAAALDPARPPSREDLEARAAQVLAELSLPLDFLGFAMVALNNAFWRPQFEAVPFRRRLLCLPCCLRDIARCKGQMSAAGLACVGCSDCTVHQLKRTAEALGYRVVIAEGTPSIVSEIMECDRDAILGVACLDALEKAFRKVTDVGVPHIAVPLVKDGCVNTVAELDQVLMALRASGRAAAGTVRSYVPLLRESARIFTPESLAAILPAGLSRADALSPTGPIAVDWLGAGGKRFRPFATLAAYAVSRYGAVILAPDADVTGLIPQAVKKLAVAIEVLHKASLAHDDIEDDDAFRYGRETLHRAHGLAPAINVGDYLIGLGYRLIADERESLGADCIADILAHLSAAHLDLCRGQGAELSWQQRGQEAPRPADVLAVYALKTAPAFQAALYTGLRAAGTAIDLPALRQFSLYLGEAYQVLNDLDDWRRDERNKVGSALDAAAERPTLLRAFTIEAGGADRLAAAAGDAARVKALYQELGAFEKAERLVDKLRDRAAALTEKVDNPALRDLMLFIVRTVL